MKEINDNWVFIKNKSDLNQRTVNEFWARLSMFISLNAGECPNIVLTSKKDEWKKYEGERGGRAFYDEITGSTIFWLPKYDIKKGLVQGNFNNQSWLNAVVELKEFKYAIPTNDIYHEMFHHVQFILGDWLYDDLLEASAEHATFLITGQELGDYIEERVALWYIGRKMLKLQSWEFCIFIRDCIVDKEFYKEYFYDNPSFVKILASEYGGDVEKLFNNMKQKLGRKKWYSKMMRDMRKIHTQMFYKW